jgi:hypothetical protein
LPKIAETKTGGQKTCPPVFNLNLSLVLGHLSAVEDEEGRQR